MQDQVRVGEKSHSEVVITSSIGKLLQRKRKVS